MSEYMCLDCEEEFETAEEADAHFNTADPKTHPSYWSDQS